MSSTSSGSTFSLLAISPFKTCLNKRRNGISGLTINIEPAILHISQTKMGIDTTVVHNVVLATLSTCIKAANALPYIAIFATVCRISSDKANLPCLIEAEIPHTASNSIATSTALTTISWSAKKYSARKIPAVIIQPCNVCKIAPNFVNVFDIMSIIVCQLIVYVIANVNIISSTNSSHLSVIALSASPADIVAMGTTHAPLAAHKLSTATIAMQVPT